jgi:hypothetical protein
MSLVTRQVYYNDPEGDGYVFPARSGGAMIWAFVRTATPRNTHVMIT